MVGVEFGCKIVEAEDGPLADLLPEQLRLCEKADQGSQLFLAPRQVLSLRCVLERQAPIRTMRSSSGVPSLAVPLPALN